MSFFPFRDWRTYVNDTLNSESFKTHKRNHAEQSQILYTQRQLIFLFVHMPRKRRNIIFPVMFCFCSRDASGCVRRHPTLFTLILLLLLISGQAHFDAIYGGPACGWSQIYHGLPWSRPVRTEPPSFLTRSRAHKLWKGTSQACGAHFNAIYDSPSPVADFRESWESTFRRYWQQSHSRPATAADLRASWEGTFWRYLQQSHSCGRSQDKFGRHIAVLTNCGNLIPVGDLKTRSGGTSRCICSTPASVTDFKISL